jgi:hypothetical protein
MKRETVMKMSLAAVLLALPYPNLAQTPAGDTASLQPSPGTATPPAGDDEASRMVSARASLAGRDLDARKVKAGDEFRATLRAAVQLKDGPELPAGTALVGVVGTDDMQMNGDTKLALRFTKAELKDGTAIPIKATIVGIFAPESENAQGNPVAPGDQARHLWHEQSPGVDEIGALEGVDLHSRISSSNSGVLVSTTKHDVKLKWGSEIAMGIAPQAAVQQQ